MQYPIEQDAATSAGSPTTALLIRRLRAQTTKRFSVCYLLSLVVDLATVELLIAAGINIDLSQLASFLLGAIFVFGLVVRESSAHLERSSKTLSWNICARFLTVSLLALSFRSAVLLLLLTTWHWQAQTAILVALLSGATVLFVGIAVCAVTESWSNEMSASRWPLVTLTILIYLLALKLTFMGVVNLIPEEAYYWNYAQHLDLSYLDHPPAVAWLIWLSTFVLGKSELSVRVPAFICWIIAALFMFRLTLNMFDKTVAFRTILLLAVLPIYFGLGFFMTPDAPLYAAWAGCLYFLERALLSVNRKAWWGVGVCMGIGLLSKYPIALLGLATLIFVLVDHQSRRWLRRPEPYLAAMIALAIFTPVLVWNMGHDWISFMFQGPDRWDGSSKFYLHVLIGSMFLLLTPTGLIGIVKVLWPRNPTSIASVNEGSAGRRRYLWAAVFTLVPLSVFVFFSLSHQIKLNWTAPVWLAAIPLAAWDMIPHPLEIVGSATKWIRRTWMPTIIVLLIIHGAAFYYISMGLPGTGSVSPKRLFGPWRQLGDKVERIENAVEAETKSQPIIVGMDKNHISSLLSFYDFVDNDAAWNTGGPHLFGGRSLMWELWLPASKVVGRNFLMVDFDRKRLADPNLSRYFDTTSKVFTDVLDVNDRVVGRFHWRIGYHYHGLQGDSANNRSRVYADP
jgi:dolichol-phosphate mannosyltransferase